MSQLEHDDAPPPKRIRRLDEHVVNRIAAGEVVQRPASAAKELLENAIDAGSTRIQIVLRDGGVKALSVTDNGHGIALDDLPVLCERHTTTKITTFDDLAALSTHGFRGEALASMSMVGHVTVTTKTSGPNCAYRAGYADGTMKEGDPKPVAANDGTTITVEDLFWNVPIRRKSLKSASDEYNRTLEMASRYAIHYSGRVGITCKKHGAQHPDLVSSDKSTALENIGRIFGEPLRRELVRFELLTERRETVYDLDDSSAMNGAKIEGYVSNANFSAKKSTFVLFINSTWQCFAPLTYADRLVSCAPLQRTIEAFYSTLLPKGGHPFVYLSLALNPATVDANVHPTKSEVKFLDEEDIIEAILAELGRTLEGANQSRTFKVQTLLPGVKPTAKKLASSSSGREPFVVDNDEEYDDSRDDEMDVDRQEPAPTSKTAPQKLVRTDPTARTLDSMMSFTQGRVKTSKKTAPKELEDGTIELSSDVEDGAVKMLPRRIETSHTKLTSVNSLRRDVATDKHKALNQLIQGHTFVGLVGSDSSLALVQQGTKLYMLRYPAFAGELFYQLALRQFGSMSRIKLSPPPNIRELIDLAVSCEPSAQLAKGGPARVVDVLVQRFIDRRAMLSEYFALDIREDGTLDTIPLLLPNYVPNLDRLPIFLLRAGAEVDWNHEQRCFATFIRELAFLYEPGPSSLQPETTAEEEWTVQHVIMPALKLHLEAPQSLLDDVIQLTSMQDLYRVFERC